MSYRCKACGNVQNDNISCNVCGNDKFWLVGGSRRKADNDLGWGF